LTPLLLVFNSLQGKLIVLPAVQSFLGTGSY